MEITSRADFRRYLEQRNQVEMQFIFSLKIKIEFFTLIKFFYIKLKFENILNYRKIQKL